MKKKIRNLFIKLFARKAYQPFFKKLHWLALRGMNYGGGYGPHDSGEIFLLKYIQKQTQERAIIFDVGANIGEYALIANDIFKNTSAIHSFEPAAVTFSYLKERTKGVDNIKTMNKGVGDTSSKVTIYYDETGSVQSSLLQEGSLTQSETIELTTIKDYCDQEDIDRITLLKLDVEGYEYNALQGCGNLLDKINYIQFEFGNKQVISRHFLSDFINLLPNFKVYRLVQNGFIEVNENPINEIFQTSNYVAIHKFLN